jgi:hypothetical protein
MTRDYFSPFRVSQRHGEQTDAAMLAAALCGYYTIAFAAALGLI